MVSTLLSGLLVAGLASAASTQMGSSVPAGYYEVTFEGTESIAGFGPNQDTVRPIRSDTPIRQCIRPSVPVSLPWGCTILPTAKGRGSDCGEIISVGGYTPVPGTHDWTVHLTVRQPMASSTEKMNSQTAVFRRSPLYARMTPAQQAQFDADAQRSPEINVLNSRAIVELERDLARPDISPEKRAVIQRELGRLSGTAPQPVTTRDGIIHYRKLSDTCPG